MGRIGAPEAPYHREIITQTARKEKCPVNSPLIDLWPIVVECVDAISEAVAPGRGRKPIEVTEQRDDLVCSEPDLIVFVRVVHVSEIGEIEGLFRVRLECSIAYRAVDGAWDVLSKFMLAYIFALG